MKNLTSGLGKNSAQFIFKNPELSNSSVSENITTQEQVDAAKTEYENAKSALENFQNNDSHYRIKRDGTKKLKRRFRDDEELLKSKLESTRGKWEDVSTAFEKQELQKKIKQEKAKKLKKETAEETKEKLKKLQDEKERVEKEKEDLKKIQHEKDRVEQNRRSNEVSQNLNEKTHDEIVSQVLTAKKSDTVGALAFGVDRAEGIRINNKKGLGITWGTEVTYKNADGTETKMTLSEANKLSVGDTISFVEAADKTISIVVKSAEKVAADKAVAEKKEAEKVVAAKTAFDLANQAITTLGDFETVNASNIEAAQEKVVAAKKLADKSDALNSEKVDRTNITELENKITGFKEKVAAEAKTALDLANQAIATLDDFNIVIASNIEAAQKKVVAAKKLADKSDALNSEKVDRTKITELENKIASFIRGE